MSIFACNACNYLFSSSDNKITHCPKCGVGIVLSDIEGNRKIFRAAVRKATSAEITSYENAVRFEALPSDLESRIAYLNDKNLIDDEHNLALVLLYYFNKVSDHAAKHTLRQLLTPRESFIYNKMADTACGTEYGFVIKEFKEDFENERKSIGTNDTAIVAEQTGNESAASTLMRFRRSRSKPNRKTPNLATIRELDPYLIASEPS